MHIFIYNMEHNYRCEIDKKVMFVPVLLCCLAHLTVNYKPKKRHSLEYTVTAKNL